LLQTFAVVFAGAFALVFAGALAGVFRAAPLSRVAVALVILAVWGPASFAVAAFVRADARAVPLLAIGRTELRVRVALQHVTCQQMRSRVRHTGACWNDLLTTVMATGKKVSPKRRKSIAVTNQNKPVSLPTRKRRAHSIGVRLSPASKARRSVSTLLIALTLFIFTIHSSGSTKIDT
jgi:hypothetical protein